MCRHIGFSDKAALEYTGFVRMISFLARVSLLGLQGGNWGMHLTWVPWVQGCQSHGNQVVCWCKSEAVRTRSDAPTADALGAQACLPVPRKTQQCDVGRLLS